mmetsp:Transcript_20865/g.65673  ORF Transcript_20865/g.65673 Transcript_20865/m.65673 type:complete len:325 (+) Transcript_20865:766-1740(+)
MRSVAGPGRSAGGPPEAPPPPPPNVVGPPLLLLLLEGRAGGGGLEEALLKLSEPIQSTSGAKRWGSGAFKMRSLSLRASSSSSALSFLTMCFRAAARQAAREFAVSIWSLMSWSINVDHLSGKSRTKALASPENRTSASSSALCIRSTRWSALSTSRCVALSPRTKACSLCSNDFAADSRICRDAHSRSWTSLTFKAACRRFATNLCSSSMLATSFVSPQSSDGASGSRTPPAVSNDEASKAAALMELAAFMAFERAKFSSLSLSFVHATTDSTSSNVCMDPESLAAEAEYAASAPGNCAVYMIFGGAAYSRNFKSASELRSSS